MLKGFGVNSDKERELFEKWGWEYDYIKREWKAPDGYSITNDTLVAVVNTFGPEAEPALINVIKQHGKNE